MENCEKDILNDKLTQADLIKLMLHNAQHMATREEVKSDISRVEASLRDDMSKLEANLKADISRIEAKFDRLQWLIISSIVAILLKEQIINLLTSIIK